MISWDSGLDIYNTLFMSVADRLYGDTGSDRSVVKWKSGISLRGDGLIARTPMYACIISSMIIRRLYLL